MLVQSVPNSEPEAAKMREVRMERKTGSGRNDRTTTPGVPVNSGEAASTDNQGTSIKIQTQGISKFSGEVPKVQSLTVTLFTEIPEYMETD